MNRSQESEHVVFFTPERGMLEKKKITENHYSRFLTSFKPSETELSRQETEVVYHSPKKSGNFGWNVNGKINFVSPNGNFLGKTGFLER